MTVQLCLSIVILGFIGGITPGPILVMAFSEILMKSKRSIKRAIEIILVTVLTETLIAVFLITTARILEIPAVIFHAVSIIGISILFMLSLKMFRIKEINTQAERKETSLFHIFLIMIFNGPLWMFWISICLPIVNQVGEVVQYGEYLYLIIFEISMIAGITLMFFIFTYATKNVGNNKTIKKIYISLGIVLSLLASKMLVSEIKYFTNYFIVPQ